MGLGRQSEHQEKLFLALDGIPRSRGYAFYDRLQHLLQKFRFDAFIEKLCQPHFADKGHPSIPPYARPLWRDAASLVARQGERPETLPAPCGRTQSRPAHAGQSRLRHSTGLDRGLAGRHLDRTDARVVCLPVILTVENPCCLILTLAFIHIRE